MQWNRTRPHIRLVPDERAQPFDVGDLNGTVRPVPGQEFCERRHPYSYHGAKGDEIMTQPASTMRALRLIEYGQAIDVGTILVPRPDAGEVLVRVRAAGLNPVDTGLIRGPLPFVTGFTLPGVPGWDVAGTVVMLGPGVSAFAVGDDVFGLSRFPRLTDGTFAEYTTVPAADLAVKPDELPWEQAGALPLVGLTALQAFDAVGGITPKTRVLIEAAAGGVGHVAAQIAKAAGATVIGTASSARHEFLRDIGVDEPIDYTTTPDVFAAAGHVDGVLLSSTPRAVEAAAKSVREGGFLVSIMHDVTEEIAATAEGRGVRHADILVAADGAGMRRLAELVSTGQLTVRVAAAYPLDQADVAYEQVRSRRTPGKVVLIP
jgi:NADPH:quinone reductase-like Zn-dependent oxidoreductase